MDGHGAIIVASMSRWPPWDAGNHPSIVAPCDGQRARHAYVAVVTAVAEDPGTEAMPDLTEVQVQR